MRRARLGIAMILGLSAWAPRVHAREAASPSCHAVTPASAPHPLRLALDLGGFAQRMIVLPVHGGEVGASLGVDFGAGSRAHALLDVRLEAAWGKGGEGLATRTFRLGPEAGVIVGDRLRLGGGLQLVDAGFWRKTTGDVVAHWLWGFGAFASVDVARFDEHALYVSLRGNYDFGASAAKVWDGTLAVGFRF